MANNGNGSTRLIESELLFVAQIADVASHNETFEALLRK